MVLAIFFSEYSLKVCSRTILIIRCLSFDFFLSSLISYVKRNANATIEQQKCKGLKNLDRLLILKMEFNNQIFQRNENLTLFILVALVSFSVC